MLQLLMLDLSNWLLIKKIKILRVEYTQEVQQAVATFWCEQGNIHVSYIKLIHGKRLNNTPPPHQDNMGNPVKPTKFRPIFGHPVQVYILAINSMFTESQICDLRWHQFISTSPVNCFACKQFQVTYVNHPVCIMISTRQNQPL